ncbi:MAG TPA: hypothetical protein VGX23_26915 [Actinocrinis sp.]|nr:hypothetical protein [Actinocrinis sp.]
MSTWYSGDCFIISAEPTPTWAIPASTSGSQAPGRQGTDTRTSRRTTSGCWIAVRAATPPPSE